MNGTHCYQKRRLTISGYFGEVNKGRISMTRFEGWKWSCVFFLLCAATAIASPAQTFKTLVKFNQTNGANAFAPVVQGTDGNFYGTTYTGGANCTGGCGTVFRMTSSGTLTTLHSFCAQQNCRDGAGPIAGLVLGKDGNFYGTTGYGGNNNCILGGCGTVFKITPRGTLTKLYSFCAQTNCPDGAYPNGELAQAADGNFYGTTFNGGIVGNCTAYSGGCGTIFKMTPAGHLTTLYKFCRKANCTDGAYPYAGLIQAADGNLYGTTANGGVNCDCGTVFKITPSGKLTTLHSFKATDGSNTYAGLVQATDGNFYGTTTVGGTGDGTVFKITPSGALTTLYNFCPGTYCADGVQPSGLIQATDGNFYATNQFGGDLTCNSPFGCGTVFKITPGGTLTTLHRFQGTDGDSPYPGSALVQGTDGNFYGTTQIGGDLTCNSPNGCGTSFSVHYAGLGPFVKTLPTSGSVGAKITILGTNLKGTTRVTFNGTAAQFSVVSKSEITTIVPTGGTTGKVKVKTRHGTLVSNVNFRVTH
jgi:uncharacterized repeat protein (TIGR03803 family)